MANPTTAPEAASPILMQGLDGEMVQRAREVLAAWKPAYRGIRVGYVSARTLNGAVLVGAVIELRANSPPGMREFSIETAGLFAGHCWVPADATRLETVIERALSGIVMAGGRIWTLHPEGSGSLRANGQLQAAGAESALTPTLRIAGGELYRLLNRDRIAAELRASDPPFSGLDDLAAAIGLGARFPDLATLDLVASPLISLSADHVGDSDRVRIECRLADGLPMDQVCIGVLGAGADPHEERILFRGHTIEWKPGDGAQLGTFEVSHTRDEPLRCFLTYRGHPIQDCRVVQIRPAIRGLGRQLWEVFDIGLAQLEARLFPKASEYENRTTSDQFEEAVAALFSILGFPALSVPSNQQQKAADIVLTTPGGNVVLVECTLENVNKPGKLSRLVNHGERFTAILRDFGHPEPKVLKVIVSPRPHEALLADFADAANAGVVVLCGENLRHLITQSRSGMNVAEVHAYLMSLAVSRATLDPSALASYFVNGNDPNFTTFSFN